MMVLEDASNGRGTSVPQCRRSKYWPKNNYTLFKTCIPEI